MGQRLRHTLTKYAITYNIFPGAVAPQGALTEPENIRMSESVLYTRAIVDVAVVWSRAMVKLEGEH